MKGLLGALWHFINFVRRIIKTGLIMLFSSILALAAVETAIVAYQKTVFSKTVAIVGGLWILTTMLVLFLRSTFIGDKLLLLSLVDLEPGKTVLRWAQFFFAIESTIVVFFWMVPVSYFWSGLTILPVLFLGLAASGSIAKKKWDFATLFNLYTLLIAFVLIVMFFIAGYEFFTGQDFSNKTIGRLLNHS